MEAIWVAAEMRAGGAFAHSALVLEAIEEARGKRREQSLRGWGFSLEEGLGLVHHLD